MPEMKNQPNKAPAMIWIVEDHDILRARLDTWIEFLYTQFQVIAFQNAEDALELLKSQSPALVLIDIGLPGMNGIAATQIIKQEKPETHVIVTTQLPGDSYKNASLKAGADAFITKDQLFQALVPIIDRLLID